MPSTSRNTSIAGVAQSQSVCAGARSVCVTSPVTMAIRTETQSGKHLHLFDGGVLGFVEYHHRIVQRCGHAHVSQRRDFYDVAFHQFRYSIHAEHFVQGVIERTQIRVDLLAQVAGQKSEFFAGCHCGPEPGSGAVRDSGSALPLPSATAR